MPMSRPSNNRLVTLRPGRYWKVNSQDSNQTGIDIRRPTNALLLEFQGYHSKSTDQECWHALVDGEVILVWESSFSHDGGLP